VIALWLLLAHLVGDYLIQTRWQAVGKFGWTREAVRFRTRHVLGYLIPFAPIALAYGTALEALGFLVWLGVLHWLTDAQRITVTPGEWLWWHIDEVQSKKDEEGRRLVEPITPNPWPSLPLAIDQTLHVAQITILGWWFLT
jgi:uncharacterized protein DUF3307